MTTIIAHREEGRWHLSADSRGSYGTIYEDTYNKLRTAGEFTYSIAGDARLYIVTEMAFALEPPVSRFGLLKAMTLTPEQKARPDEGASMLAIDGPGRHLWLITTDGEMEELHGKFYALGSGEHIALGALAAGASVSEAFRIVKSFDSGTGGPIRSTLKKGRR